MNGRGNVTTGILIGVGISAGAYYLYMRNKDKVDGFLSSQGMRYCYEHAVYYQALQR